MMIGKLWWWLVSDDDHDDDDDDDDDADADADGDDADADGGDDDDDDDGDKENISKDGWLMMIMSYVDGNDAILPVFSQYSLSILKPQKNHPRTHGESTWYLSKHLIFSGEWTNCYLI